VITEYNILGQAKKKEMALIHKSAQISYDGSVLGDNQPVYLAQRFNLQEIGQIKEALGISQTSSGSAGSRLYYSKTPLQSSSVENKSKDVGKNKVLFSVGVIAIASVVLIRKYLKSKRLRE